MATGEVVPDDAPAMADANPKGKRDVLQLDKGGQAREGAMPALATRAVRRPYQLFKSASMSALSIKDDSVGTTVSRW
jgi:hypothetical protein